MSVVSRLLQIKEYREDKAQRDVSRASRALEDASAALDAAHVALKNQRADSEREERKLYDDLYGRCVRLADLQDVALQVEGLKQKVKASEEQVDQAGKARATSEESLSQARQFHQAAIRAREKFDMLKTIADGEEAAEATRVEDAEMEEVRCGPSPLMEAAA